jgi:predicted lipoprotein
MTETLMTRFAPNDLRGCTVAAMHVVMATRLHVLYEQCGRDPLPDLAIRLRSMRAARAVATLSKAIGRIWPETFAVHRPCCMLMSPDESLLAQVATAAARGRRGHAMDAMRDLLPAISRERLFRETIELVDAIRAAHYSEATG